MSQNMMLPEVWYSSQPHGNEKTWVAHHTAYISGGEVDKMFMEARMQPQPLHMVMFIFSLYFVSTA